MSRELCFIVRAEFVKRSRVLLSLRTSSKRVDGAYACHESRHRWVACKSSKELSRRSFHNVFLYRVFSLWHVFKLLVTRCVCVCVCVCVCMYVCMYVYSSHTNHETTAPERNTLKNNAHVYNEIKFCSGSSSNVGSSFAARSGDINHRQSMWQVDPPPPSMHPLTLRFVN
jgi:hypothetical protein